MKKVVRLSIKDPWRLSLRQWILHPLHSWRTWKWLKECERIVNKKTCELLEAGRFNQAVLDYLAHGAVVLDAHGNVVPWIVVNHAKLNETGREHNG